MRTLILLATTLPYLAAAQSLMPWPQKVEALDGVSVSLRNGLEIKLEASSSARVAAAAARTQTLVQEKTGVPVSPGAAVVLVRARRESARYPRLVEDESYVLSIDAQRVRIDAPTEIGALRGLATLVQCVTPGPDGWYLPGLTIEDAPRFPWRGITLDNARHWFPVQSVKRTLDGMAMVKMNVLHWHLSDDQGFRVESLRYPKLHQLGSDGRFFTQEQIREVIDYAADRGIRVVPEFDMPGHTTSWLVGYPELGTLPGPYQIERKWGIFDATLDPTKERVYDFLNGFIGEMAGLFPDEYFHIGGDEVSGKHWNAAPHIAAYKQAHGLKDNHDLQASFNQRLLPIVTGHKKKMMGWDEILHPQLPNTIVVHSWRGAKSLSDAAVQGYNAVLSAGYYLDYMHPAAMHYAVDPHQGVPAAGLGRVLGGEACMWNEYVSPETLDTRIWPRTAAIAERFWSPATVKDAAAMYRRLDPVSRDLELVGLTHRSAYRPMLERIAGSPDIAALQTLADVVEPVKVYKRGTLGDYTSFTPLNRLVDAARPESDTAREFGSLVSRYVGTRAEHDREAVRGWLVRWRDASSQLQSQRGRTHLLDEALPAAEALSIAASVGLAALDGTSRPGDEAKLKMAEQPRASVLVVVVPHIRKLLPAAAK